MVTRQTIDSFKSKRVLVIGDVMLDVYHSGTIDRQSPEAPVPVVTVKNTEYALGGAANVAKNLVDLGAKTTLIGLIGVTATDLPSRILYDLVFQSKISDGLFILPGFHTITKTRVSAPDQLLRIDQEENGSIVQSEEDSIISCVANKLQFIDVLILSDYRKGCLTDRVIKAVIALARTKNIPIVADPKGNDCARYDGVTVLKPNEKELAELAGWRKNLTPNTQDNSDAIARIEDQLTFKHILVTRSEEGMDLYTTGKLVAEISAVPCKPVDVTGAGDTVTAILGLGLASKMDILDTVTLANVAASLVVQKQGTATITQEELIKTLKLDAPIVRGLLSLKLTAKTASNYRDEGLTIVFVNGCFDLLHPGHVQLLQDARSLGQTLFVGINSDSSVQELKGSGRPIQNQYDRARTLLALRCVDYVTIFDHDPSEVISQIKPDILVVGEEYRNKEVIGRDIVEKRGGKVVFVPLLPEYSTTKLIEKIKNG